MLGPDENGVYARVAASAARRIFACLVVFALGLLLLYLAMSRSFDFVYSPLLLALGVLVVLLGERLRRATLIEVVMTRDGILTDDGKMIAQLDDIVQVERGAFAMKPSNGFTLVMKSKQPRAWAPGLWWRVGRRVGVGGVTAAGQTKFMAEQIALHLAQRQ